MVHLLQRQSRRRGFDRYQRWTMFGMLLFLTPAVSAAFTESAAFKAYLFTLAAALVTLAPLVQLAADGVLLVSLRRERCLEEILGTRTSAREVVDQVAAHGILSVLRLGLSVVLPVLAGLLILFPGYRLGILTSALGWVPAVGLAAWTGSYIVQAAAAWTMGWGLLPALLGYAGLVSGLGLLAAQRGLPAALTVLVLVGLGARVLACRGLERPPQRPLSPRGPTLSPRRAAGLRNPIAFREASRRVRAGSRPWVLALALGGSLALCAQEPWRSVFQPLAWMALVVVQPLRASVATAAALAAEREARTLEPLLLSGLHPREFLEGWASQVALPLVLESLLLLPLLALSSGSLEVAWGFLQGLPDLVAKTWFGAWLGLCVSAFTRTRRDAWVALFLAWVGGALYLSLAPGTAGSLLTTRLADGDLAQAATVVSLVASLVCTLFGLVALRILAVARVRLLFAPQAPDQA